MKPVVLGKFRRGERQRCKQLLRVASVGSERNEHCTDSVRKAREKEIPQPGLSRVDRGTFDELLCDQFRDEQVAISAVGDGLGDKISGLGIVSIGAFAPVVSTLETSAAMSS